MKSGHKNSSYVIKTAFAGIGFGRIKKEAAKPGKAKDILEIICRFVYNVTGILNKCYINKLRWWVNEETFTQI